MPEPTTTQEPKPQFTPKPTFQPKVEQAKEPPKELLKQTFSIEGIDLDEGGKQTVTTDEGKTVKEVKTEIQQPEIKQTEKVEEKKEEKKEEKVEQKEEKKSELPPYLKPPVGKEKKKETQKIETPDKKLITVPDKSKQRDYSIFPVEDVPVLKQMSNEAFAHYEKQFKELTGLRKQQTDIFLQHPNAFQLSPEYQQLNTAIARTQFESEQWAQCLEKLSKGEPINPPVGWNEKGELVLGNEMQPSQRLEEQVRQNMILCNQAVMKKQEELQTKQVGFKNQLTQDYNNIQAERKARFDWVRNPELLDYTISMPDAEGKMVDTPIKDIRQTIIDLFPPYKRNDIAVEVVGDMFVAMRLLHAELAAARAERTVASEKLKETQLIEPSSNSKQTEGKKIGGVSRFSLEDMPS